MSGQRVELLLRQALGDHRIGPRAFRLLAALCFMADENGRVQIGGEKLAERTFTQRRTVQRRMPELIAAGYVDRTTPIGPSDGTIYVVKALSAFSTERAA